MKTPLGARIVSGLLIALALLIVVRSLKSPKYAPPLEIDRFAALPVQETGRIKPMDTVARSALLVISGKQSYKSEDTETGRSEKVSAIEWFAELTLNPPASTKRKVFRIDHPDIVGMLGEHNEERNLFSFDEISPHFDDLTQQFALINSEAALQTPYDRALLKLKNALSLYDQLSLTLIPVPVFGTLSEDYKTIRGIVNDLQNLPEDSPDRKTVLLAQKILRERYTQLSDTRAQAIPPIGKNPEWHSTTASLVETVGTGEFDPVVSAYADLAIAYRSDDAKAFSNTLNQLENAFEVRTDKSTLTTIDFEGFLNRFSPFSDAMVLYILVFLCAAAGWLVWPKAFFNTALVILLLAFTIHTFGIVARIVIQDRPPVTNLYSAAITVGWASVLVCILLEYFFRYGIASVAAALIGFPTLIIAHHLSLSGDTMEVMRAVLDSNFWLGTHVPTITIGYSATFLAGSLAIIYLVRATFGAIDPKTARIIERMTYGVVCFALLTSFVGTVLGGIWADQSWGRFWGWDPKENGALMIVLWNALFLHAHWAKVVSPRGLMQIAVFGNVITAWSFFGTNMLGVGLHSYGFMDKAFFWLMTFFISQVVIIALGWIPAKKTAS